MNQQQRKTLIIITVTLILCLSTFTVPVEAKQTKNNVKNTVKNVVSKLLKKGFIVREDLGNVIRYKEYIPLNVEDLLAGYTGEIPPEFEQLPDSLYYTVNVYAIETDDTVYLIDAGHEMLAKRLYARLKLEFRRKPITVLLTHGHADHAGGGNYLQKHGAKVYVHGGDFQMVQDGYESPLAPDDFKYKGYTALTYPMGTDPISFDGFQIIYTPGHTAGSVSLIWQETGEIFTGDLTIALEDYRETLIDFTPELTYFTLASHAYYSELLYAQQYSISAIQSLGFSTLYPGHYGPYDSAEAGYVLTATYYAIDALL